LLESRSRRNRLAALEVDQLTREPEADRAPEVLLEQPPRDVGDPFALVECARAPGCERVRECGETLRLAELGLPVHDPQLDRGIREVRTNAPPELRMLGDRAGAVEERDVVL